jgi:hypothetical protein
MQAHLLRAKLVELAQSDLLAPLGFKVQWGLLGLSGPRGFKGFKGLLGLLGQQGRQAGMVWLVLLARLAGMAQVCQSKVLWRLQLLCLLRVTPKGTYGFLKTMAMAMFMTGHGSLILVSFVALKA